jgi:hypothetical protein
MSNGVQGGNTAPESRSVYNNTGSTIPKGTLVNLKAAGSPPSECEVVNAIADVVYGVAAEDIETASYGLVYIRGCVQVLAHAALVVGTIVTAHTNGRVISAATGGRIVGVANEIGASGVLTEIELAGPGAGLSP